LLSPLKPCPNCGSKNLRSKQIGEFVACQECGLLRRARPLELAELQVALDHHHAPEVDYVPDEIEQEAEIEIEMMAPIAPELFNGSASALDIACGFGGFMAALNRRGIRSYGIEASLSRAQKCRARGLDVRDGRFNRETMKQQFAGLTFDLISLRSAIHYMDDPGDVLDLCASELRPGGYLLVQEHMHSSPFYWLHPEAAERVGTTATVFFSANVLRDAIRRRGFQIVAEYHHPVLSAHLAAAWRLPRWSAPIHDRLLHRLTPWLPADTLAVLARKST